MTSVIGRNIDPNILPLRKQSSRCYLLSLYFTIHPKGEEEDTVLYKSETIDNTLNPNWKEFDAKAIGDPRYLHSSNIVVNIWGSRNNSPFTPIVRYDVSFSGLVYLKEHLRSNEHSTYESNSLLFGMFGGYYMSPSASPVDSTSSKSGDGCDTVLCETIDVPTADVSF